MRDALYGSLSDTHDDCVPHPRRSQGRWHPKEHSGTNRSSGNYASVPISSTERKPFVFSSVETTGRQLSGLKIVLSILSLFPDNDEAFGRTNLALGEIIVSVHETALQSKSDAFQPPALSSLQVHEKSKKAAVHGAKCILVPLDSSTHLNTNLLDLERLSTR